MSENNSAERLMNALISKMEVMDGQMENIREQNLQLRKMLHNPAGLLKRAGFVRAATPAIEDVWGDPLREDAVLIKGTEEGDIGTTFEVPKNNEQFHEMNWSEIHQLANQAKDLGHYENKPLPE
jgi:hypothetical protein|tara:strand:+ start:40 stop:411 length:372 start_codon:yes stop_codon:yes gene_type:complete